MVNSSRFEEFWFVFRACVVNMLSSSHKTWWVHVVVIGVVLQAADCGRLGGGRFRTNSRSRPHYNSHPAALSYPSHHSAIPSTAAHPHSIQSPVSIPRGNGAVGPPAPNYGFNVNTPKPPNYGFKHPDPQGSPGSVAHGTKASAPPAESVHVKPVQSGTGGVGFKASAPPAEHATAFKPAGNPSNPPPYGFKPVAPVGPPTHSNPVANVPPGAPYAIHPPPYTPHNPGVPPPAYNPAYNPAGYGPPPAYNSHATGYGGGYPQQQYHPAGYGYPNQHYGGTPGVTNININNINTNTHHYGGGGFGGYSYPSYPSYHYSSGEVGSGALGFFLGYSLAKVTTPTFYHHSFYDGYTPRYDHYDIHHYYHNSGSIPAQSTIQPNAIVGCVGDSGSICPSGTSSLCTNNGVILCVASATSTLPCTDAKQGNCVQTVIPCVNGTGGCDVGTNTTLSIPCISKAQVPGNITYINNTIIVNQTTIINNYGNGTNLTETVNSANSTVVDLAMLSINSTTNGTRTRRDTPGVPVNDFCVTIVALPAEKKPSTQQQVLQKSTGVLAKFLVRALGVQ